MSRLFAALAAASLCFVAFAAHAANRTAWTAGNGAGYTWTSVCGTEVNSLASGSTVLCGTTVSNQSNQDIYADISVQVTTASSATPAAGSYIEVWEIPLLADGTTYGDGELSQGGSMARAYPLAPVCTLPLETAAATSTLNGLCQGIVILPGSFALAIMENSGTALSTSGNTIKIRTYNLNLNN